MYNMLVGITSEIERIKVEIAKRNASSPQKITHNDSIEFSYNNLVKQVNIVNTIHSKIIIFAIQEMLGNGNGIKYETEVQKIGKNNFHCFNLVSTDFVGREQEK